MIQQFTSANTSINSKKLPAIFHKINWNKFPKDFKVLDIGCGKYITHINNFVKQKGGIYFGYDKYNQSAENNKKAVFCNPDIVVSANTLNTIKENEIVSELVFFMLSYNKPIAIQIYCGDKSNVGRQTKKDCYQRNQTKDYYCLHHSLKIRHGVITNDVSIIL